MILFVLGAWVFFLGTLLGAQGHLLELDNVFLRPELSGHTERQALITSHDAQVQAHRFHLALCLPTRK